MSNLHATIARAWQCGFEAAQREHNRTDQIHDNEVRDGVLHGFEPTRDLWLLILFEWAERKRVFVALFDDYDKAKAEAKQWLYTDPEHRDFMLRPIILGSTTYVATYEETTMTVSSALNHYRNLVYAQGQLDGVEEFLEFLSAHGVVLAVREEDATGFAPGGHAVQRLVEGYVEVLWQKSEEE